MFSPESRIEHLTAEFEAGKARIWADADKPLEEKGPAVERLWREFDRQRKEVRSAYQEEAAGQELTSPKPSRAAFLPRRRRPSWK